MDGEAIIFQPAGLMGDRFCVVAFRQGNRWMEQLAGLGLDGLGLVDWTGWLLAGKGRPTAVHYRSGAGKGGGAWDILGRRLGGSRVESQQREGRGLGRGLLDPEDEKTRGDSEVTTRILSANPPPRLFLSPAAIQDGMGEGEGIATSWARARCLVCQPPFISKVAEQARLRVSTAGRANAASERPPSHTHPSCRRRRRPYLCLPQST